jgi:hypothetical protein
VPSPSLSQGFLPTLLEDVPDMAVKFAVYETLRPLHAQMLGGRQVRWTRAPPDDAGSPGAGPAPRRPGSLVS